MILFPSLLLKVLFWFLHREIPIDTVFREKKKNAWHKIQNRFPGSSGNVEGWGKKTALPIPDSLTTWLKLQMGFLILQANLHYLPWIICPPLIGDEKKKSKIYSGPWYFPSWKPAPALPRFELCPLPNNQSGSEQTSKLMDTRIKKRGMWFLVEERRTDFVLNRKAKETQGMEFIILYLQLSTKSLSAESRGSPDGDLHSLQSKRRARKFTALFI